MKSDLNIQARLSTVDGKGVGRWRNYYRAEDMREAKFAARHLVPSCQVRVMVGRECVAGPMRARDFQNLDV